MHPINGYEKIAAMNMDHQPKIFQAMEQPDFYDHPVTQIEQRETHISRVFLAGDYVYKIKKPLDLAFLNYTTLAKRRHFCRQEIDLNRRLSHDVYLSVVPITFQKERYHLAGPGKIVEYAVKMRRLPDDCSMVRLLKRDKIDRDAIERLVNILAAFYNRAAFGKTINTFGSWKTIKNNLEDNFDQAQQFVGKQLDPQIFQIVRAATRSFMQRKKALFQHRIENEKIRDCHGDLRSGHIYFDNGIQIIDCIEFNQRFRYQDVASDLAFLAMDLDFEGYPQTALDLLDAYVQRSQDADLFVLIDFYKCHRAIVRAKVNCLYLEHKVLSDWGRSKLKREIQRYMDLAYRYAVRFTRPTVWIICGLPASGKSAVADALAERLNITVLRSDSIRRELFGLHADAVTVQSFGAGIYAKEARLLTYGKLLLTAQQVIEKGESVILDATFNRRNQRSEALRLARDQDAGVIFIECLSPLRLLKKRLLQRDIEPSLSDARIQHLEHFSKEFEPLDELGSEIHVRIDTRKRLQENMQQILSQDYFLLSKVMNEKLRV